MYTVYTVYTVSLDDYTLSFLCTAVEEVFRKYSINSKSPVLTSKGMQVCSSVQFTNKVLKVDLSRLAERFPRQAAVFHV